MNRPLTISVVAPVYGVEKYIGKFAVSLLSQSYPHVQYVFVNDGTKDASISILNSVIDSDFPHLRDKVLIVDKENGGLPAARRTGMEHVTGDYVWHVDPDDWIEEGALCRIADCIRENDFPDFVYFDFFKEYPGKVRHKTERQYSAAGKETYIRAMYNHRSFGCVWNKCVKRSVYEDNQVYFPLFSYAEDTYLTTQLAGYSASFCHLDAPLYHYRKGNPDAITRQNRKKRRREYALNFLDLYQKYRDVPSDINPVSVIFDDILVQAGWYSIIYGLDLFRIFPWLSDAVSKARIKGGSDVCLLAQLIAKVTAFLKTK